MVVISITVTALSETVLRIYNVVIIRKLYNIINMDIQGR